MGLWLSLTEADPAKTCPHCGSQYRNDEVVFEANITHNVGKMAKEAGVYERLWHPEESNVKRALDLITPLEAAIFNMKQSPEYYKRFDAKNGWGTYEDFVPWLKRLLYACQAHPYAIYSADL